MKKVAELTGENCRALIGVFCDIDDTLTWHGKLVPEAFLAMQRLRDAGLRVIPVTGRPGGWVDQIARLWPVDGVVGENGGLWFYLDDSGKMVRSFLQPEGERRKNRERLSDVGRRILTRVHGTALASDQPYRDLDVAIDFCEDVARLDEASIDAIVREFHAVGATCKVSSIHVNGWYGQFDKLTGCRRFVAERFGEDLATTADRWMFVGDSANDEPMFATFPCSIGVANVSAFLHRMKVHPAFVTEQCGGHGFAELAEIVLAQRR